MDSRTTSFIPKALLICEDFSKSIVWEGLLSTCQPKAKSKELLELFEINEFLFELFEFLCVL